MEVLPYGDQGVVTLAPRADRLGAAAFPWLVPARRAWYVRLTGRLARVGHRRRREPRTVEEAEWKALPMAAMSGVVVRPVDRP